MRVNPAGTSNTLPPNAESEKELTSIVISTNELEFDPNGSTGAPGIVDFPSGPGSDFFLPKSVPRLCKGDCGDVVFEEVVELEEPDPGPGRGGIAGEEF